jgi:peptide/nickel transport system substrate-binding protein
MSGNNLEPNPLSRRGFLKLGGTGAAALGGATLLAACGSGSSSGSGSSAAASSSTGTGASAGTPKKGGTLRIGVSGGGPTETLDAQKADLAPDIARAVNLFEPLVAWNLNMGLQYVLAESMEPVKGGKEWVVKVRPNVEFHSGRKLTADDVVFSLKRIITDKLDGIFSLSPIEVSGLKAVDAHTVRIPMTKAYPQFPQFYASLWQSLLIVPEGYEPSKPNGTGPFKYQSFTPGQQSTFVSNPNYWQGAPHVDTLVITDYADEDGQVNALLSNQVDAISLLSYASTTRLDSAGAKTVVAKTGVFTPLEMDTALAPFDDVRVRQALRLVVDRPKMLEVIFGGNGRIGNDLPSPLDPFYDHALPQRVQDIDQAKSLLKAAGRSGLAVTLNTADVYPGVTDMAQTFAAQASAAGIKVNLNTTTTATLDGPNYGKWPFATSSFWFSTPYLAYVAQGTLGTQAPYNVTHFSNPKYNKLYEQAFSTSDKSLQREIENEMQVIDYNSGGTAIPYFLPTIDGLASNVEGTQTGEYGMSFGNWTFRTMWLS